MTSRRTVHRRHAPAAPCSRSLRAVAQANTLRWVVPYPPGGGTDVLGRTLAEAMRGPLGMTVVIDNKPGASTNIAAQDVARAAPDGRTVLQADNALLAFNEHLFKKLPVDPDKDFSYIGGIGKFPLALVVHPDFPAKNFKEFLAYVRANPGNVSYASPGNGSPHHLAMEMFKNRTRTFIMHIPYRGAAPAMQDVMAGQVPVMFLDLASGLSTMQSGKVRVHRLWRQDAHAAAAGRADADRGERARRRGVRLPGPARPGRHAAADGAAAQRRVEQGAGQHAPC